MQPVLKLSTIPTDRALSGWRASQVFSASVCDLMFRMHRTGASQVSSYVNVNYGSAKVIGLGWPLEDQEIMSKVRCGYILT